MWVLLRKIRESVAEIGCFNTCLYAMNQAAAAIRLPLRIFRYYFVAQPVPDRPLLSPRRGAAIAVREVERDNPVLAALPLQPSVLDYRFGQGAVCLGAFSGDRIVGCIWFCFGGYDEDEVVCRFVMMPPSQTAWDFDVFVVPEARGGLTFVRMWNEANAYLRARGIRWSLSRISAFNLASLAAHTRLGARPIASAIFVRLGSAQMMLAGRRPYVGLTFGAWGRRSLEIWAPADADRP